MAKTPDYELASDVIDIVERMLEKFPTIFEGFDPAKVRAVITKKKAGRMKLHANTYPRSVFSPGIVYFLEACGTTWKKMTDVQKRLEVFHIMCSIPRGGFDPTSKDFGKKLKPEIEMFLMEFAASGGVPNWLDNPAAADPLAQTPEGIAQAMTVDALPAGVQRQALTADQVASP